MTKGYVLSSISIPYYECKGCANIHQVQSCKHIEIEGQKVSICPLCGEYCICSEIGRLPVYTEYELTSDNWSIHKMSLTIEQLEEKEKQYIIKRN